MILVIGGSGTVGGRVVAELSARGEAVRVMSRRPQPVRRAENDGVVQIRGDLCDRRSLLAAVRCASVVVCTAHGADSSGADGPSAVDGGGIDNLVEVCKQVGIESLVYVSSASASPTSPADIFRYKALAEARIQHSGLPHMIVRPTHFMDTWGRMLGEALVVRSRRMVLGDGNNPVSFVAGSDVAAAVAGYATTTASDQIITLGGPEAITLAEMLDAIATEFQVDYPRTTQVPRSVLRAISAVVRPVNEVRSRQMLLAALLDSQPQIVESAGRWAAAGIAPMTFAHWLKLNHDALILSWETASTELLRDLPVQRLPLRDAD